MKIILNINFIFLLILSNIYYSTELRANSISPGIVFQILASELSALYGDFQIASQTYLDISKKTNNPEAAKRATELALTIGDHSTALEAAKIWKLNSSDDLAATEAIHALYLVLGKNEDLINSMIVERDKAFNENRLENFYAQLSNLVNKAKNPKDSLMIFEKVSENDQLLPDVLYSKAMLNYKVGNNLKMENILRKLIDLKPDHAQALNALGYTLADNNKNLDEALRLVKAAIVFLPGDPHIIDSVGWVYFKLGELDKAEEWLSLAFSSQPDPEISAHYGEVLWNLSSKDEALNVWRQGFKANPNNSVLLETLSRLKISIDDLTN